METKLYGDYGQCNLYCAVYSQFDYGLQHKYTLDNECYQPYLYYEYDQIQQFHQQFVEQFFKFEQFIEFQQHEQFVYVDLVYDG